MFTEVNILGSYQDLARRQRDILDALWEKVSPSSKGSSVEVAISEPDQPATH